MLSEAEFLGTRRWKRKREAILRRDGYLCQECKRYGRKRNGHPVPAEVVHHIQHYDEHPELALDDGNLISLCEGCHNKMHPERGGQRRSIPPRYDRKTKRR